MMCECPQGCGVEAEWKIIVYGPDDLYSLNLCQVCVESECGDLSNYPYDEYAIDDVGFMTKKKPSSFEPTRGRRPLP